MEKDDFTSLLTQFEFGSNIPSDTLNLNSTIKRIPAEVIPYKKGKLILEKETGSWCFLSPVEYEVYLSFDGRRLAELVAEVNDAELKEFIVRLYWFGLLQVDERRFFEPDIFREGPISLPGPLFIILLTERCNLSCKYCFSDSEPSRTEEMPWETVKQIIDLIITYPYENLTIEFAGGEPLLKLDLIEKAIAYARTLAHGKTLRFILQTNGTLLNAERLQRIKALNIEFSLSIDGDKSCNDMTRQYPSHKGSHKNILNGITIAQKNGVDFGIICVVSQANFKKITSIAKYFSSLGFSNVKFNPIFKLGRAKEKWEELALSAREYLEVHREYLDYVSQQENPIVDTNIYYMLRNIGQKMHSYRCMRSQCGAGRDFFSFTPDGRIFPCDRFREYKELEMGNINEVKSLEDMNHSVMQALSKRHSEKIDQCSACLYKRFCEAGCPLDSYYHYHSTEAPHPWCEYYQGIFSTLFEKMLDDENFINKLCPETVVYNKSYFQTVSLMLK